ncbi:MAG: energy-coupling factor transporter transmembrane protein EcfT [Armatimonadota bacterium]|nr:energy-coupling factor transporter transmembrane protein EcfT [Armatimonadota bacterium]MDR7454002.1 energy-coupling factor transporter transmembrane protein EcfT [Armatimonadota bacterium]MDR7456875.1 energy-coupling factor transporter transmembrane protein EcfT [Armatimonadota bacterium]MDR7495606.1 energy-coupling factor transporter transmembrane protein EcfT [Armatimonadota bacterium]MDR7511877.1 energy-coupling factor transporter transmembrane protein EcfT [Armatimonadota bacterium]
MGIADTIALGQYLPRASALHRLDPRAKIVAAVGWAVVLFFVPAFAGLGLAAAGVMALLILGRIPLGYALRGLRPLVLLIALSAFLNAFFAPDGGPEVLRLGPLIATEGGLRNAAFVGLRLVLLVALASLLTFTTSPVELTDGLERLLRPLRRVGVPAHELAMMMTIALRFIPTLLEETDRIMKAQIARGADFDSGGMVRRLRALIPLLVPLLVSAFRRSEDLALAMEARCYRGGAGRTRMHELRWRAADLAALAVAAAAAAGLLRVR